MARADTGAERAEADAGRVCPTCGESFPASYSLCPHDASRLYAASDRPEDRLLGVVLAGTYRVTEVLGEGAMARVYAAEHVRLGSKVACKVIHEEIAKNPEMLARFEREARAAARIQSDHVVRVIDVVQTPAGLPCMVTELLEGEDLKERLERSARMKPKVALEIARQLCRAVGAAHREGVTHRDLKPSNVFLTGAGDDDLVVKVLDFGVAKLDDDAELTKTGALVGTIAYMPPEQARRAADAGPLSDIYTLGAVIYHMVAGQPPYGKDPGMNPLILLLGGEPEAPREIDPKIPVGVEAVIQKAMARDPEHRHQTAEELESEIAAIAEARARRAAVKAAGSASAPEASAGNRDRAEAIVQRARRARPIAVAVAVASTILAGCYVAALVAALFTPETGRTGGERTMIALIGLGAGVAVGWLQFMALRRGWRSVPAVTNASRTAGRALVAGVVAFGALELAARGLSAIQEAPGGSRSGWAARLIAAGAVAAAALAWPRLSRQSWLRRLIG